MRVLLSFVALGVGAIVAASQLAGVRGPLAAMSVPYVEMPAPRPALPDASLRIGGSSANAESGEPGPTRGGGRGPTVLPEADRTPPVAKSADVDARTRVRAIQIQLKKSGCYGGPVNGEWTASSKRAMADFLVAINATLPVDQPDAILAALVTSQSNATCGGEPARVAGANPDEDRAPILRQPRSEPPPRRIVEQRRETRRPPWTQNVFDKVFGGG